MAANPHDIVPAHLAVQAMRDNGYKNAAYALAELMDNSIQAGATQVELLCAEKKELVNSRQRSRIYQVAVLDNGCGMDTRVLRMALQFGNGTHLEETDERRGIGRFGMGLPSSSISQCQRVEVWSWKEGVENALYSYLDLDEIRDKQMTQVPEPQLKPIPPLWLRVGTGFEKSGTLVVWSDIDRCIWKTGSTIIVNSELLIGRMYRKFLNSGQTKIRMLAFDVNSPNTIILDKLALPNDPGYLMAKTSCPEPFNETSMFQPWIIDDESGTPGEITFTIEFEGKQHKVKVRFSYAKPEARQASSGRQPGALPHGKHAEKNVGISIVRAERELELDRSLVNSYDPTERWWGVEVEFPPSLDNLFGVTNNKQSARNFTELLKINVESLLEEGQTVTQLKEQFREDGDPRGPLLEIADRISKNLRIIRGLLDKQSVGTRNKARRHQYEAAEVATQKTKERQEQGFIGETDKDELMPLEVKKPLLEETFTNDGIPKERAEELTAVMLKDNLKYYFESADLETPAFFSVKLRAGAIIILLNRNHSAYKNLVEVLEKDIEDIDIETLNLRSIRAKKGLELLLYAWARYEDEQPNQRRHLAQEARVDWGRIARQFLEEQEE
jgi:hypothetical protein